MYIKKTVIVLAGLITSGALYAQNPVSIQSDIKNFGSIPNSGSTNRSTGLLTPNAPNSQTSAAISTFSTANVVGSQYLYGNWTKGSVTSTDNTTYSNNYAFNFDKINHEVYAKYNEQENLSVKVDKSKIKRFTIGGAEFISSSLLGKTGPILFYQVLVEDSSKISLYKLIKTRFQRANPEDMSTVKSGNFTSAFVDDITYYIRDGKDLTRINLTENNIYKVLRSKSDKLNTYFNLNGTKDLNEQFLIELIIYLNS
jgi:hypothetical protein